ncbi:DUF883 family protein [Cognatishimia maritima]|uniref:DUF3618 domain-containing protein n=1 Tax=Cognatishimia maritima TaxID=870908 RepID=A0A1M5PKY0_9RHOB|nr:DUF883 family protein [Cognatishimia maritima]SHH02435.1 protein of unknown function [Cognatishimia maritima]
MTHTDALEKQVASNRRRLAQSLTDLTDTLAPQAVSEQIFASATGYGDEVRRQAVQAAKRNPAALLIAGTGLALMLTGTGGRRPSPAAPATSTSAVPALKAFHGFDERVAKADAAIKKEMTGMTDEKLRTSRMRDALETGLDALPESARKRVMKARKAALDAQQSVEAHATEIADRSRTYFHQNPLAVGAIAVGMGALIGALLPSTRREDEILGAHRDALVQKAEETLREEMDRVYVKAQSKLDQSTGEASTPNSIG